MAISELTIEPTSDTAPAAEGSMEYRAVIECTQDPCTWCHSPAARRAQNHPDGPFTTAEAARKYGWGMNLNVYGASVHRVHVESRQVGPWTPAPAPTPAPNR